jgi:hypothetical protein
MPRGSRLGQQFFKPMDSTRLIQVPQRFPEEADLRALDSTITRSALTLQEQWNRGEPPPEPTSINIPPGWRATWRLMSSDRLIRRENQGQDVRLIF